MRKVRIIERTFNEKSTFVIQQKHFLFRWQWVDAWINSADGAYCKDSYRTLEEAKDNLLYFDGSKAKDKEVYSTVKVGLQGSARPKFRPWKVNSDTNADALLERLHAAQLVPLLRAMYLSFPVTQDEAENVEQMCKDAADKIVYLLEANDD